MGKKRKRRRTQHASWFHRNLKYLTVVAAVAATVFIAVLALNRPAPVTAGTTPRPVAAETVAPEIPSVQIIGDSYAGGSAMNTSTETVWASLLGAELGVNETVLGFGGIGYVAKNEAVGDRTFVTETSKVTATADVIVFFGSRNDTADYTTLYSAATTAFANATAAAPTSKLLVVGPAWVNANPPAAVITSRDAVRDAATAAGATWIDPLTEGWFTEGNAALIGADGVHPTDQGHAYIAEKLRAPIAAALTP